MMSNRTWTLSSALALIVLAALDAGCGGSQRAAGKYVDRLPLPPDTLTERMSATGSYGGRFVVGATAGPKTFNAILSNESSSNDICNLIYIALTDIDYQTQQDVPLLAKSWEFTDGGRTVTFHLRHGACFSDGHPITSADVKFCFDVVMDSTVHPSMQEGLAATIGGKKVPYTYRAPDEYTFVVTAPQTDALLLSHCSNVRILPRHKLEPEFLAGRYRSAYGTDTPPESLVTSGPFRIKEYVADQKTVLARNPYWFGVDAKGQRLPYLDEVVFAIAKDQNVAALKFHAGELDGLDNVKPEDYKAYEDNQQREAFTLYDIGPSFNTLFFWFNLNRVRSASPGKRIGAPHVGPVKYAWFSDPVFRRAVSKAIDRDAIIRGPFYGYGVKNWTILTAGNKVWYDSTVTGYDYDPEGAKRLLDGLGLKDRNADGVREDAKGHPVSFTMITNGDNRMRMEMANFIRDDLARVGIRMIPAGADFTTLVTRTRDDYQYEACLLGLGSAVPSDPGMGVNFWNSSGVTHYWNSRQPPPPDTKEEARIDALMQENLGTLDLAKRRETFREISQIANDQCWLIWLPVQRMRIPVRTRFGNIEPSPMPHRILWNADRIFVRRSP